jgi:hypothetical protein
MRQTPVKNMLYFIHDSVKAGYPALCESKAPIIVNT